jgi:hypothetical protein
MRLGCRGVYPSDGLGADALYAAVLDVRAWLAVPSLVLVARMASPLSQRLSQAPAVRAGLGWLRLHPMLRVEKLCEPTVDGHVAPTTENLDVGAIVIAGVAVLVVPLRRGLAAAFTVAQSVRALCARALALRSGLVAFPCRMRIAASGRFASEVSADRAGYALSPLILVASAAQSAALPRRCTAFVLALSHATNVTPNGARFHPCD